ncbi:MAG: hypothetical protein VZQ55_06250 [Ruminococcus sp.]|nr:hypothetical protein [Ruminococcus sp.]
MKKVLFISFFIVLSILISSCNILDVNKYTITKNSNNSSDYKAIINKDVSNGAKQIGKKAIAIVDKYIDFSIDGEEAVSSLHILYNECPEKADKDFIIKIEINVFKELIEEVEEGPSDKDLNDTEDFLSKKLRELAIERNNLSAYYIGYKPATIYYSVKPQKIKLKELINNPSEYENKIITTTIDVTKVADYSYSYTFLKKGYTSCSVDFITYGINCNVVNKGKMTVTGCVCDSSDNKKVSFVRIAALDEQSVLDSVDESLFTDLDLKKAPR